MSKGGFTGAAAQLKKIARIRPSAPWLRFKYKNYETVIHQLNSGAQAHHHMTMHSLRFSKLAVFAFCCGFLAMPAFAKPVPENLGNGLEKLVENNLIQKGAITAAPTLTQIA